MMLLTLLLQAAPFWFPLITTLVGSGLAVLATWLWTRRSERRTANTAAQVAEKEKLQAVADAARVAEVERQEWMSLVERVDNLDKLAGQFVEADALNKRFGGIEHRQDVQGKEIINQANTLHEYERERERLAGEFRAGITQLNKDVHALEAMPGRVTQLETKLDNLSTQITDLKQGQRDLRNELREDMKSNKNEVLAAIRELKNP